MNILIICSKKQYYILLVYLKSAISVQFLYYGLDCCISKTSLDEIFFLCSEIVKIKESFKTAAVLAKTP